jgi:hypothetical protein
VSASERREIQHQGVAQARAAQRTDGAEHAAAPFGRTKGSQRFDERDELGRQRFVFRCFVPGRQIGGPRAERARADAAPAPNDRVPAPLRGMNGSRPRDATTDDQDAHPPPSDP